MTWPKMIESTGTRIIRIYFRPLQYVLNDETMEKRKDKKKVVRVRYV